METKKKNRFDFGPKTYSFIKYIATIGSVIFLIVPLLDVLHLTSGILPTAMALNGTTFGLWTLGFLVLGFYVTLRIHLIFVTKYKYQSKEKLLLWLAMGFYIAIPFLTLISTIVTSVFSNNLTGYQNGISLYLSISILALVLLFNIAASILETFSRIGEQQYLYNEYEKKINEGTMSESGVKRTDEAVKVLNSMNGNPPKNSKKVSVKDKKTLDDFFNKKDEQDS